jgi:hypothetical protein
MKKNSNQTMRTDLDEIERNLSLSYEQRILEHEKALALFLELQKIKQQLDDKSQLDLKKTS